MAFLDHFSRVAKRYAAYRPRYPETLFDWLADASLGRQRAWDCGTGNGQAATSLARRFAHVIGSDPSAAQLINAVRATGITYVAMTAERAALSAESVDLVTVAQALHWFDRDRFFSEAARILRPGGLLAVWSYALVTVNPEIDAVVAAFHRETLGPYWPPQRALVDSGLAGVSLPFPALESPPFGMDARWDLDALVGYVSTWSAVERYRTDRREDPIPGLMDHLAAVWDDPALRRDVQWPLTLIAARKTDCQVAL